MPPLTADDVKSRLGSLRGWRFDEKDNEIEKGYKFADFKEAMVFVNRVAELAEEADHHPNIEIEYNQVELELSTHSEGGVTEKDFALASKIDAAG